MKISRVGSRPLADCAVTLATPLRLALRCWEEIARPRGSGTRSRAERESAAGGDTTGAEPGLRIDRLVHVAVLDARGVELEVQVCAEGATGLHRHNR